MPSPTPFQGIWFALIAILWIGYFFLEGFDFGVGMLVPFLGRDDIGRRMVIRTIGPVWDGNEVWLVTAGGATFAAFPVWYATLFSSFYLALFLILAGLIVRGVAFEFRHHRDSATWRTWWDRALFVGSLLPAVLFGVAFANIVQGVPINASHQYTGTLLDLLNPYALLGGITFGGMFLLHGAVYLTLKLEDDMEDRAHRLASQLAWPVAGVLFAFLAWTFINAVRANNTGIVPGPIPISAIALVGAAALLLQARQHGWAFTCTGLAIALTVLTIFLNLWPRLLVSSTNHAFDLTVVNAASAQYTLTVMTIVAVIFVPLVLLYQGWTYWVFRQRVTRQSFELPGILRKKPTPSSPEHA